MPLPERPTEIKFTRNWGGKLDRAIFRTTRWPDKLYELERIYPIKLVKLSFPQRTWDKGEFQIKAIIFKRIVDYSEQEILDDIGKDYPGKELQDPKTAFVQLLESWYGKKHGWMEEYSIVQQLELRKVGEKSCPYVSTLE